MINYILQVVLFQVFFLAIYDFFLSKETFFTKNRWYLLSTPIVSFLIPFVKIPTFQKAVPQEFIVNLPEIFLSPEKVIQKTIQETIFYDSVNYVTILFWIGVAFFSILFLIKLVKIINLIKKYEVVKQAGFTLIIIPNQTQAFSFFNYVFLGKNIEESKREKIIQHELVHSKQKHSLDLLLFEFLKIVMWFNPMIYFYQQRITLVHEYISDAIVAKSETKESYINNLLSNFFQVENIAFVNQFYKKSLIKKRIIMITKTQSKKMNQLKYLLLIPVLASMLFYVSCSSEEIEKSNANEQMLKSDESTAVFEEIALKNGEYLGSENEVSFFNVDKAPTFPGCEKGDKACFSNKVQKHFIQNFNSQLPKELALSSGNKRVFIAFTINKEGNVEGIKTRAPHPEIEKEVIRVINSLPKTIPGEKSGKKVNVKYSIPFTIIVENSVVEEKMLNESIVETQEISFMTIDKAPTFPGCDSGDKDCFSKNIQMHFSKNFNADLPKTLGLEAGRKKIFIGFKIDKEGNIVDVQARAPHEKIEQEVVRVMNSLPKVIPGEQEGKSIAVKYSIPFVIVIE